MGAGGLSKERLGRMHDLMTRHVERGAAPGVVTVVSRRGDVHVDTIGTTTSGGSEPIRRDTIFRISSMTKPITAAATMILVEECRVRLDEPVDRLLPELADREVLTRLDGPLDDTVPARRPITVRDLLTFTLGFGAIFEPGSCPIREAFGELGLGQGPPSPQTPPPPDEWMRRFGTLPLMFQPGERWLYDTGADVLGVLIARASGQPFETFLAERLFAPLGMRDTGFTVPVGSLDRFTPAYVTDPGSGKTVVYDDIDGQWSRPPAFPSGAGGLVSTADDCLAFGRMVLDRGRCGGGRILSRPSVELMTTDQLTAEQKAAAGFDQLGYGFGGSVVTGRRDLTSIGTYGWDGGMGTSWYVDPREEMVVVLMTQRAWDSPSPPPHFRDFWTCAYQAIDD